MYSYGERPFHSNKKNLLITWLANLYVLANFPFKFSFFGNFYYNINIEFIKPSLKSVYSRKHLLKFVHLIL